MRPARIGKGTWAWRCARGEETTAKRRLCRPCTRVVSQGACGRRRFAEGSAGVGGDEQANHRKNSLVSRSGIRARLGVYMNRSEGSSRKKLL
jgi:hypothetical protein